MPALTIVVSSDVERPEIVGTWRTEMTGLPGETTLTLKVSGTQVTGELMSDGMTTAIRSGEFNDRTIVFNFVAPDGSRMVTFSGKVSGDELAFTRSVRVRDGGLGGGGGLLGVRGVNEFVAVR